MFALFWIGLSLASALGFGAMLHYYAKRSLSEMTDFGMLAFFGLLVLAIISPLVPLVVALLDQKLVGASLIASWVAIVAGLVGLLGLFVTVIFDWPKKSSSSFLDVCFSCVLLAIGVGIVMDFVLLANGTIQ